MQAAEETGQLRLFPFHQHLEQELFEPNPLPPNTMQAAQETGQLRLFPFHQHLEQELFEPNPLPPNTMLAAQELGPRQPFPFRQHLEQELFDLNPLNLTFQDPWLLSPLSELNGYNLFIYNDSNLSNGAIDTSSPELPYSSSDVSPNSASCLPSDILGQLWAHDQAKDDLANATDKLSDCDFPCHVSTSDDTISIRCGNTEEFPAQLNLMSSASETSAKISSAPSEHHLKPACSNADSGTYTCSYKSCTLRFKTLRKLQKHKREGHRNANAANMPTSLSITTAALLKQNSHIRPHRCERTNPATGKSCSIAFTRPYDLTRHENTIHNTRKQKARCVLCGKDKTFARKDGFTRHIRVIHPEIHSAGRVSGRQNHSLSK